MFVEELHRWSVFIFILVWFGAMPQPTRQGHYSSFFHKMSHSALCFRRVDWVVRCMCKCVYNAKLQIETKTNSFSLSFLGFSAHFLYMPSETSLVLFLPFLPCLLWSFYKIRFTSTKTDLSCGTSVPSPWPVGCWSLVVYNSFSCWSFAQRGWKTANPVPCWSSKTVFRMRCWSHVILYHFCSCCKCLVYVYEVQETC